MMGSNNDNNSYDGNRQSQKLAPFQSRFSLGTGFQTVPRRPYGPFYNPTATDEPPTPQPTSGLQFHYPRRVRPLQWPTFRNFQSTEFQSLATPSSSQQPVPSLPPPPVPPLMMLPPRQQIKTPPRVVQSSPLAPTGGQQPLLKPAIKRRRVPDSLGRTHFGELFQPYSSDSYTLSEAPPETRPLLTSRQTAPTRPRDQIRASDQPSMFLRRYHKSDTNEPDFRSIQADITRDRYLGILPKNPDNMPSPELLANRHRRGTIAITSLGSGKAKRQKQELADIGYVRDVNTGRYVRPQRLSMYRSSTPSYPPPLRHSQSMPNLPDIDDEVSRPIKGMGHRQRSNLMPTGRLDYGLRWDPNLRRSYSVDDLTSSNQLEGEDTSKYTSRERAFAARLSQQPKEDVEIYKKYRNMADKRHKDQRLAVDRMFQPWTDYGLSEVDSARVGQYRNIQDAVRTADKVPPDWADRRQMRRYLTKNYATLKSANPNRPTQPFESIQEMDEPSDDDGQQSVGDNQMTSEQYIQWRQQNLEQQRRERQNEAKKSDKRQNWDHCPIQ